MNSLHKAVLFYLIQANSSEIKKIKSFSILLLFFYFIFYLLKQAARTVGPNF
jgi:hypothetical protein